MHLILESACVKFPLVLLPHEFAINNRQPKPFRATRTEEYQDLTRVGLAGASQVRIEGHCRKNKSLLGKLYLSHISDWIRSS